MPTNTQILDYETLRIARGLESFAKPLNIFGYNPLVGDVYIPLWENATPYTFPSSALIMTVTSNIADAGAVIKISGLDENYTPIFDTLTLDPTGTTTTSIPFFRINEVACINANGIASGNPANNVTISNSGVVYAKIRGGEGKSQAAIYTVPANYSFYLMRIDAFCATALQNNREIFFRNYVQLANGVAFRVAETSFLTNMSIQRRVPFRYGEKTDIQFQLRASGGTQYMSVFGEGILVKEGN
mgnify:CR=1 FL=1